MRRIASFFEASLVDQGESLLGPNALDEKTVLIIGRRAPADETSPGDRIGDLVEADGHPIGRLEGIRNRLNQISIGAYNGSR